jgi:hypothetical protein
MADTDASAASSWRKSSWSAANGHCVEVAELSGRAVGVRHSRDTAPGRPVLIFAYEEWQSFLAGVIASDFDPS